MNSHKKHAKLCQEQDLALTCVEVSEEDLEHVAGGQGDEQLYGWHGDYGWRSHPDWYDDDRRWRNPRYDFHYYRHPWW